MSKSRPARATLTKLVFAALFCPLSFLLDAEAQFTSSGATQITVRDNGDEINGSAMEPVVSPNKEIYAFRAEATNVLNTTHTSQPNIYTYEPGSGFSLASAKSDTEDFSANTNVRTDSPAISPVLPNGLYGVAFTSNATDLTQVEYGGEFNQVYLRIPSLQKTVLVSTNPNGEFANADCGEISIAALPNPDRFIVAFTSKATNLSPTFGPNDSLGDFSTVFIATVILAETGPAVTNMKVASKVVPHNGNPHGLLDGHVRSPVLSGDGKFVVVSSDARIVPEIPVEQTQRHFQIYRFNRVKETSALITKDKFGLPGNRDSKGPAISFSGGTVAFVSEATNLGGPGQVGTKRVLVKRAGFKGIVQANRSALKEPSNGGAYSVAVHPSGKFVAFADNGTNLTDSSTNGKVQTYVKSLVSEALVRTSVTGGGEASDDDSGLPPTGGGHPSLTLTGRGFNDPVLLATFQSKSTNLTLSGSNVNGYSNIFLNELSPPKPKFEKKAPIEAPPDVAVAPTDSGASGSKVTFTFQEFEDLNTSGATDGSVDAQARSRLEYHLEIRKKTGNKRKRFRKSRNNSATIRRLAPGRYVVRYRVIKKSGSGSSTTIESKSRYSPRQTIDIT